MPITTTDDAPSLPGSVLTPMPVTERAWRPRRVITIHRPSSTARPSRNGHGSTSQAAMPATTTRNRTTPTRNDLSFFMTGFLVVAASAAGQCVDDVQPHRPHRRQYADQQADRDPQAQAEQPAACVDRRHRDHTAAARRDCPQT